MSTGGWAFPTHTARAVHWFPGRGQRSGCGRYLFMAGPLIPRDQVSINVRVCQTCSKSEPKS